MEVSILATLGIGISIAIVGFGLHYLTGLPFIACFLFGTFISATDPVAVLAIFREMRAPKKLSTIVDGESLLNDGTALVTFQVLFKVAVLGSGMLLAPKNLFIQGAGMVESIVFGVAIGSILGWFFSYTIANANSKGVQLTLSLILAHVTFLIAEGLLGVSGILATMAAGIVMGNFGSRKLSPDTKKSFSEIWKFLEFISNSLIFLLLGMKLGQFPFWEHGKLILIAIVLTIFIARPLSVFPSFFLANLFRKKIDKSPFSYQWITVWGGLRGALAAAAVLLIPESYPYVAKFQAMTMGIIAATFILNATTISFWLKKFNLIQLTVSEKIQSLEARILISQKVAVHLQKMVNRKYVAPEIFSQLEKKYIHQQTNAELELEKLQNSLLQNKKEIEKTLTRFALGIEIKTYKRLFELGEISEKRVGVLLGSIFRQTDRLEKNILPKEQKINETYAPHIPKKKIYRFKCFQKKWDQYRKHKITERLQHYRARRIASWRVIVDFENLQKTHPLFQKSEIVDEMLRRYRHWNANSEKKMGHLERKYPEITEPFRVRAAESSCLNREQELEKEYLEKGLISEKVFATMDAAVRRRQECIFRDASRLFSNQ